jgi:hypothetical protein
MITIFFYHSYTFVKTVCFPNQTELFSKHEMYCRCTKHTILIMTQSIISVKILTDARYWIRKTLKILQIWAFACKMCEFSHNVVV